MSRLPILNFTLLFLVASSALACGTLRYKEFLLRNTANSAKLSLNMTKAQVMETMGHATTEVPDGPLSNPWKVEAFLRGDDTIEVLYYLVRRHPPFTPIREGQAITAVLKNGALVAWGRGAHLPFK